jgi:hypothetical protein
MPRYFFNVEDHPSEPDLEGTEVADLEASRREAMRYAAELLQSVKPDHFVRNGPLLIRVADESGHEVIVLEIRDKLALDPKSRS